MLRRGCLSLTNVPTRPCRFRLASPSLQWNPTGIVCSQLVSEVVRETEASSVRPQALAASPPKKPNVMKRAAMPEVCISSPKTKRRRRRRRRDKGDGGGDGGDGDGGGGDFGDWDGNWSDGESHRDGRLWMWLVLMAYSLLQGLLLLLDDQSESSPSSLFATIAMAVNKPK